MDDSISSGEMDFLFWGQIRLFGEVRLPDDGIFQTLCLEYLLVSDR